MNRRELLSRLFGPRTGRAGALVLAMFALVAIFAEWIACDTPLYARYQGRVYVLPCLVGSSPFAGRRADQNAALLEPGDFAVWPLLRVGPSTITEAPPFSGPSLSHVLGTDAFGRDVFARLVHGTRTALTLGAVVAALAASAGSVMGAMGGALGGFWDGLVERLVEVVGVFPAVLAIALVRALERHPSLWSLVVVMTAVEWALCARLVRALVRKALGEDWALGARAGGASSLRIVWAHVSPHLLAPIAVATAFAVASVVLTETSLSFLDLGVPSAYPSWGEMLGEVRWGAGPRIWAPAVVALGLLLGALYAIADAIRQAVRR